MACDDDLNQVPEMSCDHTHFVGHCQ